MLHLLGFRYFGSGVHWLAGKPITATNTLLALNQPILSGLENQTLRISFRDFTFQIIKIRFLFLRFIRTKQ
jgi:hypothetical protein